MLIGGQWVSAVSGKTFPTVNPATGEVLAHVPDGDAADVDKAVRAARRALEEGPWSRMTPAERSRLLYKLADKIEERATEFAQLETLDNGKTIRESANIDIPGTVEHFRYFAGWATKITGETIPVSVPGHFLNYTRREPVGVVGQIIPWNFPLLMAAWKIAPALACGNTVVLKPAEQTPLTALLLGELIQEVGFPDGVVNIVTGFGETAGAALVNHPDVDKIAFTGSTEVGRKIMQGAAGNMKRVSLELGGKSPNIIFPDADLSKAIPGAIMGIYFNQGQVCAAGSRVYVQKGVFDNVVSNMVDYSKSVRLGPGIDPQSEMGPLVSNEQFNRVMHYIERGREEGAELLCGGARPDHLSNGYFVQPTVFVATQNDLTIMREEIFGPVVVVSPFNDIEDIVKKANDTMYGLAAGVWTNDIRKAHRTAHLLKAGTVWVNCYNLIDNASPWGGFKQSGIGREMGHYALELYTEVKSVWVNLD
ncbi:MAG: aldehyde dehydrogenase family protein [Alicyclobacillaceae bacterium]|nr:aldehyde dehydrogenase family protein [Alicyclobacillaceae bacterium]